MEERGVQNLNFPQGSGELYTAVECISREGKDIPRTGHSEAQLSNLLPNFFHPPCNQAAQYSDSLHRHWDPSYQPLMTIPTVPSPEQIPETTVPMTQSPGLSHLEDEFRAFSDDQIRANGGRPTTYQEDSFGGTNSPFDQGSRNDMQLRNPNLYSNACHGQSSHVSPQQLEDMSGTHPFEHCSDRRVQAPEFGEFQWIPERGIARSSKNRIRGSKKWPCDHGGCDKRYGRRQEAIRHMRDKHGVSPKCFICGFKWTRAEKIKGHLLSKHQHHFTEEERQEIYHLRGQNNTIDLLERLEITGR